MAHHVVVSVVVVVVAVAVAIAVVIAAKLCFPTTDKILKTQKNTLNHRLQDGLEIK